MQVDQNQWCPVRMSHWREMKSIIIILTPYHVLLGPWDCTTNSTSLHCWTPSSHLAWYRHTCSTCTPALRAHLQYVHTCSTPAVRAHLQYVHTCSTCTPAVRAHLQYVHTCSTCTPALHAHLQYMLYTMYMNEKASKCIHLQYIIYTRESLCYTCTQYIRIWSNMQWYGSYNVHTVYTYNVVM